MKALVSFLSFLGRGAAKLIAWLLFKLGLWVPAVFSLLFVLVVLVTGTSFKDVLSIYLFCLIATVIFAIAVNVLLFFRRIDKRAAEKKRATAFISDTKPSEDKKVAFVAGANDTDVRIQSAEPTQKSDFTGGKPEDKPLFPTDNVNPDLNRSAGGGGYYTPNTANGAGGDRYYPSETDNRNTDKGRYFTAEVKDGGDAASTNGFLPYNVPLHHEEDERRFSDESRGDSLYGNNSFRIHAEEKPMIFRTRMDSTLLIYEYSDRLEFYRKTPDGPVKLSVEYKNKY